MSTIGNHKADREELNQLITEYEETMSEYRKSLHNITSAQSNAQQSITKTLAAPVVYIIDTLETRRDITAIRRFWDGMVDADSTAKDGFSSAQSGINEITANANTFYDSLGKNGGNLGSLNVEQLQSTLFDDKELVSFLTDKMENNKPLTDAERGMLYSYIHSEIFNDNDRANMESIVKDMQNNPDALLDRINEDVLYSRDTLNEEIRLVELYLFSQNLGPDNDLMGEKDTARLNAYLAVLKNYRTAIQEVAEPMEWDQSSSDPIMVRADYIDYELTDGEGEPNAVRLKSGIIIDLHQNFEGTDDDGYTFFMNMDNEIRGAIRENESEAVYYYGSDASVQLEYEEKLDLEEEQAVYKGNTYTQEAFLFLVGMMKAGPFIGAATTLGNIQKGENDLDVDLTLKESKIAAQAIDMEIQLSKRHVPGAGPNQMDVVLNPTDSTFSILERWEEVNQGNPDFVYPMEEVQKNDWYGITEFLTENRGELKEVDEEAYDYIFSREK